MAGRLLQETLQQITKPDEKVMERTKLRWDSIAKPLYSLGKLETAVTQLAGIFGTEQFKIDQKALVIMCADNGIVEEGVTQTGQEVTAVVAENFLDEQSCAAIMCKEAGAAIRPIDIGMVVDTPRVEKHKIMYGTNNFVKKPSMTREQAVAAIEVGISIAKEMKESGYQILATGEMGIGNTTTSSAVASVLLDVPVETVTGRGAGLSSEGLERKINAIKKGISLNRPNSQDPIDVLSKVGGLDIAGLVGVYLGCGAYHMAGVIDGFISAVAALVAVRICPTVSDYLLPSHVSKEPAGKMMLEALGKSPFLTCDMCLGEGSGAVLLFSILDMAVQVYLKMSTFDENRIEAYVPLS